MVQSRTAGCAFQVQSNASYRSTGGHHSPFRQAQPLPNGRRRSSPLASVVRPDRFRTTDVRVSALNACRRRTYLAGLGGRCCPDTTTGEIMGKLDGKVAVITGGSSGMALASARRFVEEGAYVRPEYARHAVYCAEGVAAVSRWRIDLHDGVRCVGERFSWLRRVCGEQGGAALICTHVAQRTEGQEYPGERAEPGADRHTDAGSGSHRGSEADVRIPDPQGNDGSS